MDAEKLNQALYDKMAAEQKEYRSWLLEQSPEEILNHAFEYSTHEDILMEISALLLSAQQAAILLASPSPLADVYKDFRDMETSHMDEVRACIEDRAESLLEALQDATYFTPIYQKSAEYAMEHGELDAFWVSRKANVDCKDAIEATLRAGYDGRHLTASPKAVMAEFGPERVAYVLAATIQRKDWDERFSRDNKAWAATIPIFDTEDQRGSYIVHIADELNKHGVLSPMAYKDSRGLPHPTGGYADVPDAKWSARAVIRILQEETYTGVLLQGRQETHNHKLKDIIQKPAEDWVRIEDAHEPIISKQKFDLVQKIAGLDTRTAPDGDAVYLFSGLLICNCCGGRMTRKTNTVKGRKYIYYYCPTGKKKGCDHPVMVKEADLIACVLASLQAHIRYIVSVDNLLDSISEDQINREEIARYKSQIADNEVKLEEARQFKATLYENFIEKLISKKDYQDLKRRYTERAEQAQEAIDHLRAEMELVTKNTSDRLRWTQHFKKFSAMTTLDRRAVIATIQSIRIMGKDDLQITFRYNAEFIQTLERLDRMGKLPPSLREILTALRAITKGAA